MLMLFIIDIDIVIVGLCIISIDVAEIISHNEFTQKELHNLEWR